ncbi:MAG: NrpR regulatory domain-containing protein [bacterium]
MLDKTEKKKLSILRILNKANQPMGSSRITEQLKAAGYEVSERTVRHYLLGMDREGLTELSGKRGRRISGLGLKELEESHVIEKVGFLAAKIDQMTYNMDFDLQKRRGSVILNVSLINRAQLKNAAPYITSVFEAGYSMGNLMVLLKPGDKFGDMIIPEKMVGIGTVCSVSLNGMLLANKIPTHSRFGGLLELRDKKAQRFVEIITYEGTSIDPLEIFIRSGMTDYRGAVKSGNGRIGVGFREVPSDSLDRVSDLAARMERIGLGNIFMIGWPGQPLLDIPVSEGRLGMIVMGGLNPAAIIEETAIKVHSRALAGFADYEMLFPYWEMEERIQALD